MVTSESPWSVTGGGERTDSKRGDIHRERPSSCQSSELTCPFSQGGDLPSVEEVEVPAPPLLLQWVKTDQALLMLFSDGTVQVRALPGWKGSLTGSGRGCGSGVRALVNTIAFCAQVNFYGDHTKLILSGWEPLLVTFVARNRSACTYLASHLRQLGCAPDLRQRLRYALRLLRDRSPA